jgi:hypothetical protein
MDYFSRRKSLKIKKDFSFTQNTVNCDATKQLIPAISILEMARYIRLGISLLFLPIHTSERYSNTHDTAERMINES